MRSKSQVTLPLSGGSDEKSGEGLNETPTISEQLTFSGPGRLTLPRKNAWTPLSE